MNEIQFNNIKLSLTTGKIEKNPVQQPAASQPEGVTVNHQMGKLFNLLQMGGGVMDDQSRVREMRQKIDNNQYDINFDALSDKLINSGVL